MNGVQATPGEVDRLETLARYGILDTAPEGAYDDLTRLAAGFCGTPIAVLAIMGRDRNWFKSSVGIDLRETPRDIAFCDHTIRGMVPFIVRDARTDPRFADNPLVKDHPGIRFYAGVPLVSPEGHGLGALCVVDTVPRDLTSCQIEALQALARQAMSQMELRRVNFALWGSAADLARARNDLLRREELLTSIVENEPECVKLVDREGRLMQMNASGLRMLEADRPDQVVGKPIADYILPEHRERFLALAQRVLAGEQGQMEFEMQGLRGTRRWMETNAVPLRREDRGIYAILAITRDISKRRKVEAALRESENRFRSLAESSPVMIWEFDPEMNCTYVNGAWLALTGRPFDEQIGQGWANRIHPEDAPRCREVFRESIRERLEFQMEFRVRRHDGEYRWMLDHGAPRTSASGVFLGFVGSCVDITERKLLEDQLRQGQKMEAIGRMAGGLAHDFNNLLTVIAGYGTLLRESLPRHGSVDGPLDEILRASDRAAVLCRQLLAFSRKQVLRQERLDLGAVAGELSRMLGRLLGDRVELVTRVPSGLRKVRADRTQIEQVLINLAINGRDAMRHGGTLAIEVKDVDLGPAEAARREGLQPGPHVAITVADTGAGMSAETMAHLFEPFFTTKAAGEGTGLGLSTVYGIVRQSGGHIEASSREGAGAVFTIHLPAAVAEAEAPVASQGAVPPAPRGSERVLYVEDSASVRHLGRRGLEEAGYRILEAADAEEALSIVATFHGRIDLLVTDVALPKMGGLELAARVREARPDVKVLFVSGHRMEEIEDRIALQKPYTPSELSRKVREVLESR